MLIWINPSPALIDPRTVALTDLPDNKVPNKLVANVPTNIPGNPSVCAFASFSIVLLTRIINQPDFSRAGA